MAIPSITNNSPSAGYITWGSFTIQYGGTGYSIPSANTNQRWVWWKFNNGSPTIEAGASIPQTLTDDDLVLFGNKNGIGIRVQSSSLVEGELLVDGSIFAKALSTNLISSDHIVTAGLDAGVIKFGEMDGQLIKANTITGKHLLVGDTENLIKDPLFQYVGGNGISSNQLEVYAASTVTAVTNSPYPVIAKIVNTTFDLTEPPPYSRSIPVANGDLFWVEVYAARDQSTAPKNSSGFQLGVRTISRNGDNSVKSVNHVWAKDTQTTAGIAATLPQTTSTFTKVSGWVLVPQFTSGTDGVHEVTPWLRPGDNPGWYVTGWSMRRLNRGELVVDGTIYSRHVHTTGLDAGHIKFGEMDGGRIKTNTLDGDRIKANTIGAKTLIVTNFDNLVTLDLNSTQSRAHYNFVYRNESYRNTGWSLEMNESQAVVLELGQRQDVAPTDEFFLSWRQKRVGSNSQTFLNLRTEGGDGNVADYYILNDVKIDGVAKTVADLQTIPDNTWVHVTGTAKIPTGSPAKRIFPTLRKNVASTTGGYVLIDEPQIFKRNDGNLIVDGTLSSKHITTAGLDAGVIKFGEMDGQLIKANTIGADKIVVADFTNYILDPWFKNPSQWLLTTNTSFVTVTDGPSGNQTVVRTNPNTPADWRTLTQTKKIDVTPGETFYGAIMARRIGTTGSAVNQGFQILEFRQDGTYGYPNFGNYSWTPTTSWNTFGGEYVVPSNVRSVQFRVVINNADTAVYEYAHPMVRLKNNGNLIVDGTIKSNHVNTIGLDAGVIKFGEMDGGRIKASTLNGDRIVGTSISGDKIMGNTIGAGKLIVSDFTNMVADGELSDSGLKNWYAASGTSNLTRVSSSGSIPYLEWTVDVASSNRHIFNDKWFETYLNDEFWYYMEYSTPSTNTANVNIYASLQTLNSDGTTVAWPQIGATLVAPNTGWTVLKGAQKITASTAYKSRFSPFIYSATTGQKVRVRMMAVRRKNNGELIVDGSINTAHVTTTGLDAQVIKFGTMHGDRITTNTLDGNRIKANTIAASTMIVSDLENILENPQARIGTVGQVAPGWTTTSSGGPKLVSTTLPDGSTGNVFEITANGAINDSNNRDFDVNPGDEFWVSGWYRKVSGTDTTGTIQILANSTLLTTGSYDYASPASVSITGLVDGTWYQYTGTVKMPAKAARTRFRMSVRNDVADGVYQFWGLQARRKNNGSLIVDGSVTTSHVTTTGLDAQVIKFGTMHGDRIQANTIVSNHISTVGLDAAVVKFGEMSGDRIAVGTLNADRIIANTLKAAIVNADAVNGITITGTTLNGIYKSSSSGNRVEISDISGNGYIDFWSGVSGETINDIGRIDTGIASSATPAKQPYLRLTSPRNTDKYGPQIMMRSEAADSTSPDVIELSAYGGVYVLDSKSPYYLERVSNPIGTVIMHAGDPGDTTGLWLLCDGRLVSYLTFPDLYLALGSSNSPWGIDAASNSFYLPNLIDRVPRGSTNGTYGGNNTVTMPDHQHFSGTLGTTTHTFNRIENTATGGTGPRIWNSDGMHNHGINGQTGLIAGGNPSISNVPSYTGLGFFIKAK